MEPIKKYTKFIEGNVITYGVTLPDGTTHSVSKELGEYIHKLEYKYKKLKTILDI